MTDPTQNPDHDCPEQRGDVCEQCGGSAHTAKLAPTPGEIATTNLPDLYRRVCEARPEAAVPGLEWFPDEPPPVDDFHTPMWTMNGHGPYMEAECVILSHWLGLLPSNFGLVRRGSNHYIIQYYRDDVGWGLASNGHASQIDCLAAFLLSTKGPA